MDDTWRAAGVTVLGELMKGRRGRYRTGWRRLVTGAAGHRWEAVSRHPFERGRQGSRRQRGQLFVRRVVLLAERNFLQEQRDYHRSGEDEDSDEEGIRDSCG